MFRKNNMQMEEKIDHLLQIVEELKSKALKRNYRVESPDADLKYRSLYIDSQKKYENGTRVRSKVIEKLKDVILISNLAKATVAAVVEPKAASKRKRLTKRIKKK
ncbi:hypothetical protein F0562_036240 [Nyssa sinensis]|uniref:Uncharacterized protein n=1 Tax=Nyssa sinensis TaxID=561372 RepID=A0A5J5ACZ8_9ASTE|nr:hypothetical protein F0562_036240 [Nyssa sinensis]